MTTAEIISLVIAGLSLAVAVYAIWKSGSTGKSVEDIRDSVDRLDKTATISERLAGEANRIAVDAKQLAEETKLIHSRMETRQTERHNVRWKTSWIAPGSYLLANTGEDEAFKVTATLMHEGNEVVLTRDHMPAGGELIFEVASLRDEFISYCEEREESTISRGPGFIVNTGFTDLIYERIDIDIVWVSGSGVPHRHVPETVLESVSEAFERFGG